MSLGNPHLHLATTASTNSLARRLGERGAPHGLLVSADFQSAGRGRQGRSWWARPGEAILASLLLRPVPPLATLRAAVAIREAIGGRAQIKWPNDLLLPLPAGGWGKVCGILGEEDRQGRFAVLGFGINVAADPRRAPPELQGRVATLGLPAAERGRLLAAVLAALERWLAAPKEQVIAALQAADHLRGRRLEVALGQRRLEGRAVGIGDEGYLLLALDDGRVVPLTGGEVHVIASEGAGSSPPS